MPMKERSCWQRPVPVLLIACVMLSVTGGILVVHSSLSSTPSLPNAASEWTAPASRMAVGDFVIYANDGRPMRIAQSYGRPMIVMLYTLDCHQCIASLRSLNALAKAYRSRADFVAVGVVREPSTGLASVHAFQREHSINALTPYSIDQDSVASLVRNDLPLTLFVDHDKTIVLQHHGPGNRNTSDVRRQLDSMISRRQ